MAVFNFYLRLLTRLFQLPARLYCWITGRDSWSAAIFFCWFAYGTVVLYCAVNILWLHSFSPEWLIIILPAYFWLSRKLAQHIKQLRDDIENSPEGAIVLSRDSVERLNLSRWYIKGCFTGALIFPQLGAFVFLFYGTATHAFTMDIPKKQHVFARAKDKIKSIEIRLPNLAPTPVPLGVKV